MKLAAAIAMLLMSSPPGLVMADGYPFQNDTHEVIGDSLQLALSESQVDEVSATGMLAFSDAQRSLLKKFYADAPARIRVISSTYNDGLDERDPNPVDCVWTSPAHVGITLREKQVEGGYTFETEADSWPLIRFSPEGGIYSRGVKITKEAAIDLIRNAKKPEGDDESPQVAITLPPPYRELERAESNAVLMKLFNELVEVGKKHNVVVRRCW